MSIVSYDSLSDNEKNNVDKIFEEQSKKEDAWFYSWGFMPAAVMGARIAYQEFLEKETRDNPTNFYKAPLARKAFMIGWLRGRL